jgi:hypothetical protein
MHVDIKLLSQDSFVVWSSRDQEYGLVRPMYPI